MRSFLLCMAALHLLVLSSCQGVEPGGGYGDPTAPCPAGYIKSCFGRCALVRNAGQYCDLNSCDQWEIPYLCGQNLRCQPDYPGLAGGTCVTIDQAQVPSAVPYCDPSQPLGSLGNMCGGYWLASDAPPGNSAVPSFCAPLGPDATCQPNNATRATCQMARVDGEACDGDWEDVIGASATTLRRCSPCAPGFRCVDNPAGGNQAVCLRRADAALGGTANCLGTPGPNGNRMYGYHAQVQRRFPLKPLPAGGFEQALVCIRAGIQGNACGASIASNETRALEINPLVPVINETYRQSGSLIDISAVRVQYRTVDPNSAINPNQTGCTTPCNVCQSTNDTVVSGTPNYLQLNEPTCCRPDGARCTNDSDCCGYGDFGAHCVEDPTSNVDPVSGTALPIPKIRVCRRGCFSNSGNLNLSSGQYPPSFVCPGHTECRSVQNARGNTAYACTPCGRMYEPVCTAPYREGCTGIMPADLSGQIVRFGNLVAQSGRCMPLACGGPGQACCPPNTATIAIPGAGPIPQGDRCQASATTVCSSETGSGTCVACGGSNQRCCDAKLSEISRRAGAQAQSDNMTCASNRNGSALRDVGRRCHFDPTTPTTMRCQTSQVCQNGSDPYAPGAASCVPCGGNGQQCCEGQRCGTAGLRCMPGGATGNCGQCGGAGQPVCDCSGTDPTRGPLGPNGCLVMDQGWSLDRSSTGLCIPRAG